MSRLRADEPDSASASQAPWERPPAVVSSLAMAAIIGLSIWVLERRIRGVEVVS